MASRIIRPIERMLVDFTSSDTATVNTIFLARRINVAAFKEVTGYLRFHPGTTVAATPSKSDFIINADGYTDEDPAATDTPTTPAPAFQTALITTVCTGILTAQAGALKVIVVGTGATNANFGSLLSVQWNVQPSTSGSVKYLVSLDLICKEF